MLPKMTARLFCFVVLLVTCQAELMLDFDKETTHVFELPPITAEETAALIEGRNFSIVIQFDQRPNTIGALFSAYSGEGARVFEIDADSRRQKLLIYYRKTDGLLRNVRTNMESNSIGGKHRRRLIVEADGPTMRVFLDCIEMLDGLAVPPIKFYGNAKQPPRMFVGQRAGGQMRFKGTITELTVDHGLLRKKYCAAKMAEVSSSTTTTTMSTTTGATTRTAATRNQFLATTTTTPATHGLKKNVDYLSHRVSHLENQFKHWRDAVRRYETQLKHVALHQRSCKIDNVNLDPGEKWTDNQTCTECTCHLGNAICHKIGCRPLDCEGVGIMPEGDCCPRCPKHPTCWYGGKNHAHGAVLWPKKCTKCVCDNGDMSCQYVDASSSCPMLTCDRSKQHTEPNHCCAICADVDHCVSRPCGFANSTCVNDRFDRRCSCPSGYFGDGDVCHDIDECQVVKREKRGLMNKKTEGDMADVEACGAGTRCINIAGGVRCECQPGFVRLDERNCVDIVVL